MPRAARKKSSTGIYHIMIRGIDRQNIFVEPEDYRKLLYQLGDCKEKGAFELYAYCLMPNHIHLLIKEGAEPIAETFRRIGSKYVTWFNTKYERVGHLFQDRFKSEEVEDDEYFLTVLRYIHFNPVKAKLVRYPGEYLYSSYSAYINGSSFVDTERALKMLPGNGFIELHAVGCHDNCLDIQEERPFRLTEEDAAAVMLQVTKCGSAEKFQELDGKKKKEFIARLKTRGLSIRQIAKLTGETYYTIQKC